MKKAKSPMILLVGFVMLLAVALGVALPAFSFLPQFIQPSGAGTPVVSHWSLTAFPLQWNLNPAAGSNITGNQTVTQVMTSSFATWTSAPNLSIPLARGADSAVNQENQSPSNINLICFVCNDVPFGGVGTLAVTITTTADAVGQGDGHGGTTQFAGQIIKADIVFNPAETYTTGGSTGQDLQTVATHEIGHFFGLDHSAVVRATMFPFAPDVLQTLSWDDVAGMAALYPRTPLDVGTGNISGTVRTPAGAGVFGAHVFAHSTTAANPFLSFPNIRKSPIGILTLPDGSYTLSGLPPDSYVVIAEPLDLPVTNADVGDYPPAFNLPAVQTNFTTRWH
jgi:hypothetical protein